MSQAGIIDFIGTHPQIPTMFVANVGTAIPIANTIELLGAAVAAHGVPLQTVASGNTVDFNIQYASAAASSIATNAGVASFNSAFFTVDANGFVSISGGSILESFTVDASTPPGTNPVVPNVSGIVTVTGGQVAAGTTTNVIRTDSLAANTYTIQIQRSQAVASSTIGDNGVSHFNSTYFTVDANGFVSINGAAIGETITGNTGGALSPTAGNWNILGTSTAAGAIPVQTAGSGSTLTVQVQTAQAIAATNATNIGLAAFNSTFFTVDANGFVSINGAHVGETITGTTGGALSPTAGNWNILGSSTAAGTTPVQTSGSGSTLTVQVQKTQAIASTDATKVGLAAFDSARFTVDANGFVSLGGTGVGETITGNTGGALSPTAGNWNILGTGSLTSSGSVSTLTMQLTGLTNHAVQVGAGTATLTQVGPSATTGAVLASNGLSSDPSFQTIASLGGITTITGNSGGAEVPSSGNFNILGTGSITVVGSANTETVQLTGLTNHNVLVGAGTATVTNVAPSATSGVPLISNGASSDPSFGTAVVAGGGTGDTSFTAYAPIFGGTTTTGALQSSSTGQSTSGFVLTSTGASSLPTFQAIPATTAFTTINIQVFAASGTYTPTANMKYCIIELVGGGGGGGGTTTCGGTQASVAGGGGSGGYARKFASAATIGASQTVTCGAGGTAGNTSGGTGGSTSVGSICAAAGGTGGAGTGATTSALFGIGGGQGGAGTTGDVLVNGNPGATGFGSSVTSFVCSGLGGASFFGGGAYNISGTGAAAGNVGTKGGGGSGAVTGNSTTAQLGGVGGVGYVVITEFI